VINSTRSLSKTDHRSKPMAGAWDRPRRGLARQRGRHRAGRRLKPHGRARLKPPTRPPNTTDVYAFLSAANGIEYLTTALRCFLSREPGTVRILFASTTA